MHISWKSRGGGVLGVLAKLFLGWVLGVITKSRGSTFSPLSCFIAFRCDNFLDLPPPSPLCASMSACVSTNRRKKGPKTDRQTDR